MGGGYAFEWIVSNGNESVASIAIVRIVYQEKIGFCEAFGMNYD